MIQAVLVWVGLVLAFGLLLLMAVGPAIVELDSWWYERQHRNRAEASRAERAATAATAATEGEQVGHRLVVSH